MRSKRAHRIWAALEGRAAVDTVCLGCDPTGDFVQVPQNKETQHTTSEEGQTSSSVWVFFEGSINPLDCLESACNMCSQILMDFQLQWMKGNKKDSQISSKHTAKS